MQEKPSLVRYLHLIKRHPDWLMVYLEHLLEVGIHSHI